MPAPARVTFLVAGVISLACSAPSKQSPMEGGAVPSARPDTGTAAPDGDDAGSSRGGSGSAGSAGSGGAAGASLQIDAGAAAGAPGAVSGSGGSAAKGSAGGAGGSGASHVPGRPVTPFGYGELRQVLTTASNPGTNGAWWCDNHFGKNLGGTWTCQSVSGGNRCEAQVPVGDVVSCVRAAAPASVDESAFAPPACDSDRLDPAAKTFCAHTEYMQTRVRSTLYLYNDWVRAGVNRSFGGALMELYGADKRNRIEEHGGSATQLSIWAYDANGGPAAFFTTESCNPTAFPDAGACKAANADKDCRHFATGRHVVDCKTEKACFDWTAAAPWNPIQAQAADCGWNGATNDVDSVVSVAGGIKLTKSNPYHFTKTGQMVGLLWSTTATVSPDRPFVELRYEMDYSGPFSLSTHNQEIPALFTDSRLGVYYYYSAGGESYRNVGGPVRRVAATDVMDAQLRLPARTGDLPQPAPARYLDATEEWMSSCDATESQCLTVVSFANDVKVFKLAGQYVTPTGRFAPAGHHAWTIYLFPYRYDDVVAGRTVREWVYDLRTSAR